MDGRKCRGIGTAVGPTVIRTLSGRACSPTRHQERIMIIATRILKLRRPEGYVDLPVHIFAPEQKDGEWCGRVEIGWPGAPQPINVNGCGDAVHVIEMSMRLIGAVLYASEPH